MDDASLYFPRLRPSARKLNGFSASPPRDLRILRRSVHHAYFARAGTARLEVRGAVYNSNDSSRCTDDQRRMFAVFADHAAPSAALMFNSGPALGESIGKYRGDPLYHASLSGDEYRELIHGIGFAVVAHAAEDWPTGGGRTVWLARRA